MSLKAFHIFFIAVSAILSFGLAVWALLTYLREGDARMIAAMLIGVASGAGLVVYGIRFLKKLKFVSFL